MKGAPAAVLESSVLFMAHGKTRPITEKDRKRNILQLNRDMAKDALRVLAVAHRELPEDYTPDDLESGYTYVGLFGMIDPLRERSEGSD
jgi:P-type Ca2+ transporter type 2C